MALASLPYPSRWGELDSPLGLLLFRYSRFRFDAFSSLCFWVVPLDPVGGRRGSGDMTDGRERSRVEGETRRVTRLGSPWSAGWSYARLMKYCAVVWDILVLFQFGPLP